MTRATIYARQSLDRAGEGAAVARQLDECRAFCAERGWEVAETFTDNDTSATSGKARPGFDALLASQPERIVVWHVDRLARLTADLERVIGLGVNVYAVRAGDLDLSNPAGRAVARTIVAWATYEGEQKAVRQRAANRQRAQRGVSRWSRRPYGFERDSDGTPVIVEAEAKVIRDAAERVLSGVPVGRVVRDLNESGVATSTGARWTTTALKRVLLSPRVAGRVTYQGEDFGESGLAILDADTADRLRAFLTDPRRRVRPPSTRAKYMLTGIARCGRDGCDDEPMYAVKNAKGRLIYRCRKCFGGRGLEDVDRVVGDVVLRRLARRDLLPLAQPDVDLDGLRARVVELQDRRDGIAAMLGEGLLSREAARAQAVRLTEEIDVVEREIAAAAGSSALGRLARVDDLLVALREVSLDDFREIVGQLVTVRILPAGKGVRFDPSQVEIRWRA